MPAYKAMETELYAHFMRIAARNGVAPSVHARGDRYAEGTLAFSEDRLSYAVSHAARGSTLACVPESMHANVYLGKIREGNRPLLRFEWDVDAGACGSVYKINITHGGKESPKVRSFQDVARYIGMASKALLV